MGDMTDWTDSDSETVGPNRPLYSAALKTVCLGNLTTIIEQSGFRVQSIFHGSSTAIAHSFSDKAEWEDLYDEWGPWPAPTRYPEGSADERRDIRVLVSGKCTYATGHTHLRIYALPSGGNPRVDADGADPLPGVTSYGELSFSGTSYTTQSTTITIDETYSVGDVVAWSDDISTARYREVALHGIALSNDVASEFLHLRAPMIEEIP